ncbi:lactonase family protein [Silvibacterium acidisoli]|uniref:lactonase family protein n=1 Tax=Acidobacteriaceae bacterium ZG23-2 TaxID=2883246 RepID=UPI00406CDB0C
MNVRKSISVLIRFAPLVLALSATGCGKFFVKQTSGGGGTTTGGSAFYVANATTSSVSEFTVSSSGVSTLSGSPIVLASIPSSLAVTPSNGLVYSGSLEGTIYAFTVGNGGVLSVGLGGSAAAVVSATALKVDPSGKWLIAVDPTPAAYVFAINTSNGALTPQGQPLTLAGGSPNHIAFNPAGNLMYVSLGTGGVQALTFNPTSGTLSTNNLVLKTKGNQYSDEGIVVDPSGAFLLVSEVGAGTVRVLSINASTGALTEVSGSPFAAGTGPQGIIFDYTGAYVYTANIGSNNISGWSFNKTSGALTAISGSPFSAGTQPVDLAEDSSHTYIGVVSEGGNPDLQFFTIGTGGALTSFKSIATDTDPAGPAAVVALN